MNMPKIQKVLYTTSMGPHSRHVYRYALQLASVNNAELVMLHVIKPIGVLGEALIKDYLPEDLVEEVHDEGIRRVLEKMKARVRVFMEEENRDLKEYQNVNVRPLVVTGRYDQAILDATNSEKADVIVMGTENRVGIQSHKTQQVIRHSKVPVYVVPTGSNFN